MKVTKAPYIFLVGLTVCWLIVIIVDMLNVAGLGELIIDMAARDGSAFVALFSDARPVEWMQWSALGGAILLAGQVSLLEKQQGEVAASKFAFWMAILFMIMLMEDAGNLRHNVAGTVTSVGVPEPFSNFYTFAMYAIYASVPAYALFQYGGNVLKMDKITLIFWSGVLFYATAAILSASGPVGNWYEHVGSWLNDQFFSSRVSYQQPPFEPGYWIMDLLIEESLELIGAILLFGFFAHKRTMLEREPADNLSEVNR